MVTCLSWSHLPAARLDKKKKQPPKCDSWVFVPTVADCSLAAPLGSVERIFPCDLLPPLVRSSPSLPEDKLSRWISLSRTHTHIRTQAQTRTPTSLFIPCQSPLHLSVSSSSSSSSPHRRSEQLTRLIFYGMFVLSALLGLLFITNSWVSRDFTSAAPSEWCHPSKEDRAVGEAQDPQEQLRLEGSWRSG